MSIVCGIPPRDSNDPARAALDVALAVGRCATLGPVVPVDVDLAGRHGVEPLIRAATQHDATLLVVGAGARSASLERLAHDATVPLLVVRDHAPFVAWSEGRAALRAVLGWDETATTLAALEPVVTLRRAGPVDLDVVHVYFPDEAARRYGYRVRSLVDPAPELEALLRRDVGHQLGEVDGQGEVAVRIALGLGHVGDRLLEHAEASRADLIVVGNHHRGGLRRLSSVAARVLTDAAASVLLVPLRSDAPLEVAPAFSVVAVATDGSAFSNRAIPYAYRLVPDHGEVHLIRVVDRHDQAGDAAMVEALLRLRPPRRAAARTVAHVVHDEDPAHAIAITAERVGADVICIASHGRGGLGRLLVGSTTDRLLHACRRPVLVVHAEE
jgi:nucleotide-binding universal stress UspA family protein